MKNYEDVLAEVKRSIPYEDLKGIERLKNQKALNIIKSSKKVHINESSFS